MNAYSMSCRDAGIDCPGSFTTESKDELIKHVQLHDQEVHMKGLTPEDIEQFIKVSASV